MVDYLAILASPFALIISIPILAVLVAIIVTVAALIFALVAVIAAIGIAAFATLPTAIWGIFTNFAAGMVTLGLDLLIIGFMLVLIPITYWMATGATKGIKELSTWIYQKIIKRNHQQGGSKK